MMHPNLVSRIKSCKGLYSVGDTAKYFNVSKSTVHDLWSGRYRRDVPEAPEPPNVKTTRVSPDVILEDGRRLLERGMKIEEAAAKLGVSPSTLRRHLNKEGVQPCYFF